MDKGTLDTICLIVIAVVLILAAISDSVTL